MLILLNIITRISPRSHHARSIFPAQTVNVCNEKFNLIESKNRILHYFVVMS